MRAGMVTAPAFYRWSSYPDYLGRRQPFPRRYRALRCAAGIKPTRLIHGFLKMNPIELTITQEHHSRSLWDQLAYQLDSGDMKTFGKMPFGALPYPPR